MISWGDIGGKRKPSRFTPVSPTEVGKLNKMVQHRFFYWDREVLEKTRRSVYTISSRWNYLNFTTTTQNEKLITSQTDEMFYHSYFCIKEWIILTKKISVMTGHWTLQEFLRAPNWCVREKRKLIRLRDIQFPNFLCLIRVTFRISSPRQVFCLRVKP